MEFVWDDFLGVTDSLFRVMRIDIFYGYVELVQGFYNGFRYIEIKAFNWL